MLQASRAEPRRIEPKRKALACGGAAGEQSPQQNTQHGYGSTRKPQVPRAVPNKGSGLHVTLCGGGRLCYTAHMPRLPRINFPNAVHHVTARGNGRATIFFYDDDQQRFLKAATRGM